MLDGTRRLIHQFGHMVDGEKTMRGELLQNPVVSRLSRKRSVDSPGAAHQARAPPHHSAVPLLTSRSRRRPVYQLTRTRC
jgi:hypothetical protein